MSRILKMTEEKVQQRTITITSYKAGSGRAVVEGRLTDRRFKEVFLVTGEKRPVGEFHDMIVRLLIDIADMTIQDLEVELSKVPRPECIEIQDSLFPLKGMRITRGFTKKMKSLLGGAGSCTHLRELLEAMAPAVFQGMFTIMAEDEQGLRSIMNDSQMMQHFIDSVVDTCHVWRKEGPELKRILNLLDESGS